MFSIFKSNNKGKLSTSFSLSGMRSPLPKTFDVPNNCQRLIIPSHLGPYVLIILKKFNSVWPKQMKKISMFRKFGDTILTITLRNITISILRMRKTKPGGIKWLPKSPKLFWFHTHALLVPTHANFLFSHKVSVSEWLGIILSAPAQPALGKGLDLTEQGWTQLDKG